MNGIDVPLPRSLLPSQYVGIGDLLRHRLPSREGAEELGIGSEAGATTAGADLEDNQTFEDIVLPSRDKDHQPSLIRPQPRLAAMRMQQTQRFINLGDAEAIPCESAYLENEDPPQPVSPQPATQRLTRPFDDALVIRSFTPRESLLPQTEDAWGGSPVSSFSKPFAWLCVLAVILICALTVTISWIGQPAAQPQRPPAVKLWDQVSRAKTWRDWQHVAYHWGQSRRLMEDFYRDGFTRVKLLKPLPADALVWRETDPTLSTYVSTNHGVRKFVAVNTPMGPRFDWESFVRYREVEWERFDTPHFFGARQIKARLIPSTIPGIDVAALSSSNEAATLVVTVYLDDPKDGRLAMLPANSQVEGQDVASLLRHDAGIEATLTVSPASEAECVQLGDPDALHIESINKLGWLPGASPAVRYHRFGHLQPADLSEDFNAGESGIDALGPLATKASPGSIALPEAFAGRAETAAAEEGKMHLDEAEARAKNGLLRFLAAENWAQKLACVIQPDRVRSKLREYYREDIGRDGDLPVHLFYAPTGFLSEADRQRGICALVKDNDNDGFGRMVLYFKDGLLDWESYIQLKEGLFDKFLATPTPEPQILRVMLRRDMASDGGSSITVRDLVPGQRHLQVPVDSKLWVGKTLAERVGWDHQATATFELRWIEGDKRRGDGQPKIILERIVCWELLGVGGTATSPVDRQAQVSL